MPIDSGGSKIQIVIVYKLSCQIVFASISISIMCLALCPQLETAPLVEASVISDQQQQQQQLESQNAKNVFPSWDVEHLTASTKGQHEERDASSALQLQPGAQFITPVLNETLAFESSIGDHIYYTNAPPTMSQMLGMPSRSSDHHHQMQQQYLFATNNNNQAQQQIRLDPFRSSFYSLADSQLAPSSPPSLPMHLSAQYANGVMDLGSTQPQKQSPSRQLSLMQKQQQQQQQQQIPNDDTHQEQLEPIMLHNPMSDSSHKHRAQSVGAISYGINYGTSGVQPNRVRDPRVQNEQFVPVMWNGQAVAEPAIDSQKKNNQPVRPTDWSNQQVTVNVPQAIQLASPSSSTDPAVNQQHQSALIERPKVAINLSSLLQPGEVLLSQQVNQAPKPSVSIVRASEMQNIVEQLKPLAMSSWEKATSVNNSLSLDLDPIHELDSDDQQQQGLDDQLEQANIDSDADDEAEMLGDGDDEPASGSLHSDQRRVPSQQSAGAHDDQAHSAALINSLAALGMKLSGQHAGGNKRHGDEYGSSASLNNELFYRAAAKRPRAPPRANSAPAIPIELLVDHLMAGSRLATRGHHHQDRQSASQNPVDSSNNVNDMSVGGVGVGAEYGEGDDDDDDYEDYEDEATALPVPEDLPENSMEASDSMHQETRVEPSESRQLSFNSVANKSDSWIPLGGVARSQSRKQQPVASRTKYKRLQSSDVEGPYYNGLSPQLEANEGNETRIELHEKKSKKKRRKRRRRKKKRPRLKRRRSMDDDTGLVIGSKRLNRAELIRLIGVLNRLASGKKPSKEREASRKLLRFLIKMALDNYKREQLELNNKVDNEQGTGLHIKPDNQDERLRNSLRSLLIEPELGASRAGDNSSRISIQLQPWRVKSALDHDRGSQGSDSGVSSGSDTSEEPIDQRPKSLAQVSEDLERYFDTDFFEDLADKNTTEHEQPEAAGFKQRKHSNRTETQSGPLLVPNLRLTEEADEEDVDLDHVQVARAQVGGKRRATKRLDGKNKRPVQRHNRRNKRPSSPGDMRRGAESRTTRYEGKTNKARGRPPANSTRDAQMANRDESDNEGDGEDEDGDDREESNGFTRQGRNGPKFKRPRRKERKKLKQKKQQQPIEQEPNDGGEESDLGSEGQDNSGQDNEEQDEENESEKGDRVRGKARAGLDRDAESKKHKRRRRRRKQDNFELDRDEIPAPILASSMSALSHGQLNGSRAKKSIPKAALESPQTKPRMLNAKEASKSDKIELQKKSSQISGANKATAIDAKVIGTTPNNSVHKAGKEAAAVSNGKVSGSRVKQKKPTTSTGVNAKEAQLGGSAAKPKRAVVSGKTRTGLGELNKGLESELNGSNGYTNEGSEVCNNDKCQLAMRSSHPLVNKYLQSQGDKKSLVNQIDKWLTEDDSDTAENEMRAANVVGSVAM